MWTGLLVLLSRVRALFGWRRLDRDFDEELLSHLVMLTEENIRRGMSHDEARRQARLRLGGIVQLEESRREARSLLFVETAWRDVQHTFRTLRKNPVYTSVAMATLAIGIGAGTSVFTFVRAVLLRPLPYKNPHELVRLYETNPLRNWTKNIVAPANWADWQKRNTVFTGIAAYEQFTSSGSGASDAFLTGFGEPQAVKALVVSGNLFEVLGAAPLIGRTFTEDEQWEGKSRVVVLSYGFWQSAFGADPAVIGKRVTISGVAWDVIGVMPRTFFFPGRDVQLWAPFGYSRQRVAQSRRPHWLGAVARLRGGVTLEHARQNMNSVAKQLEAEYPDTNTQMGVRVDMLHDSFASEPRTPLLMLSGAVGLLFLIVCANMANLQLGRAVTRSRELAIRRALGAARSRLLRQLFTESLVLSTIGGALGIGVAVLMQSALTRYAGSAVPLFADVHIDLAVVAFGAGLSLTAPILFGTAPAFTSSKSEHLTERGESTSRGSRGLRDVLVGSEVALSIVLVVGAVLLLRSLLRLGEVDPGFNQDHAVAFTVTLPAARYPDAASRFIAFTEVERRLRSQPGIESTGATSTLALRGTTWSSDATIEGRAATDFERELQHASTTRDYFTAAGIRLLAGRFFEETDTRERPPVAIVNETLARRYFHGLSIEQVVGKRITFGRPQDKAPWNTIVGIVRDEKQRGLDKPAEPTAYSPIAQRQQNPLTFVVRSAQSPEALITTARHAVAGVDKDLALTEVATLASVVEQSMEGHRFRTMLLAAFAGVALFLAALGIYGVLTYFVSQRGRELGIRRALGARPASLFAMVVAQGLGPVAIGAVAGLAVALALTTVIQSLLFGIEPIDPPTYGLAIGLLAVIAVVACTLPALRATRVDPVVALRDE